MQFVCGMGFSHMADRMVWQPSLSPDHKWPCGAMWAKSAMVLQIGSHLIKLSQLQIGWRLYWDTVYKGICIHQLRGKCFWITSVFHLWMWICNDITSISFYLNLYATITHVNMRHRVAQIRTSFKSDNLHNDWLLPVTLSVTKIYVEAFKRS